MAFGEHGEYALVALNTLVLCPRCGCVIVGDVVGQNIHEGWHDNEDERAREACGMNLLA
jgi:hypothetical protein